MITVRHDGVWARFDDNGAHSSSQTTRTALGSKLAIFVDYRMQPGSNFFQPMPVTSFYVIIYLYMVE